MTLPADTIAIHFEKGRFGLAAFVASHCSLLATDSAHPDRDAINALLVQTSAPPLILSSARSKIHAIRASLPSNCTLQLLPANDFAESKTDAIATTFSMQLLVPRSCENVASFQALNALLTHLDRMREQIAFPDAVHPLIVDPMQLQVSLDCLCALQVFEQDRHPNMHASNGAKEGFSVFSLFNHAVSDEGRGRLRRWFLHPTNNLAVITARQEAIKLLLRPELHVFQKTAIHSLKRSIKTSSVLTDLRFRPTAAALLKLGGFCDAFAALQLAIPSNAVPLLQRLGSEEFQALDSLGKVIHRVIDEEGCKTSELYTIREFINPDLDSLRQQYTNLPDFLTSVVAELARSLPTDAVSTINLVYFPQLGFLITVPVPPEEAGRVAERCAFELQFQSNRIAYYKNDRVRELDVQIGDVYADIVDAQLDIMQSIVLRAVELEETLNEALNLCSELDCVMALAKTAQLHNLVCPEMTDDPILQIDAGRHLLVEACRAQFIANDCNLSAKRMMVLTGANSSGKSVYLKQTGIIVHLAHIGSFVPAQRARIGLLDRILTRIKTTETTGRDESAFMTDLRQVKAIVECCSDRSLVLIDEFGKGTCQQDGMALFSGLLTHLANLPATPLLIAITHMHEIFKKGLVESPDAYAYCQMRVHMDRSLCYLYRLESGMAGHSYAMECAREASIENAIIDKATRLCEALESGASPQDLRLMNQSQDALHTATALIQRTFNSFS